MNLNELKKQIVISSLSAPSSNNFDELVPLCWWCTQSCSYGCSDKQCSNGCASSSCTSCSDGCSSGCSSCTLCSGLVSIF